MSIAIEKEKVTHLMIGTTTSDWKVGGNRIWSETLFCLINVSKYSVQVLSTKRCTWKMSTISKTLCTYKNNTSPQRTTVKVFKNLYSPLCIHWCGTVKSNRWNHLGYKGLGASEGKMPPSYQPLPFVLHPLWNRFE